MEPRRSEVDSESILERTWITRGRRERVLPRRSSHRRAEHEMFRFTGQPTMPMHRQSSRSQRSHGSGTRPARPSLLVASRERRVAGTQPARSGPASGSPKGQFVRDPRPIGALPCRDPGGPEAPHGRKPCPCFSGGGCSSLPDHKVLNF